MSSSLQKNSTKTKLECPSCGQTSMIRKKGSSILSDKTKVKNIEKWICENCGEELFDLKAMKEIKNQRKGFILH